MTYELTEDTKQKLEKHIEIINDVSGHGEVSLLIKNCQVTVIKTEITQETNKRESFVLDKTPIRVLKI